MLTEETTEQTLPGPRDQLGVAVDALADALAANAGLRTRVAQLEDERDRLDRKRRKWKHRAQAARELIGAAEGSALDVRTSCAWPTARSAR